MAPHRQSGFRSGDGASIRTPVATGACHDPRKQVNTAHARQRGPGERVNAELKNWRIVCKIRSCPSRASELVAAVQTLMIANAWPSTWTTPASSYGRSSSARREAPRADWFPGRVELGRFGCGERTGDGASP
jgi:hypothetical protein